MPRLLVKSNYLIFYDDSICLFSPNESSIPMKCAKVEDFTGTKHSKTEPVVVDTVNISPCGQYLAATVQKELSLFSFPDLIVLSQTSINKTASCVSFFNTQKILLVADRSGTVTFVSYDKTLVKIDVYFGHNSLLTDAAVSLCDKFVITADRDEKIRVSMFPNVYNIKCFCLGHSMFVSSLCLVPSEDNIIASASGDGSVRIWNFLTGEQVGSHQLDGDGQEAIAKIECSIVGGECLIALMRYKRSDILILLMAGDSRKGFLFSKKYIIKADGFVLDFSFWDSSLLYIISNQKSPVNIWPEDHSTDFVKGVSSAVSDLVSLKPPVSFEVLFKREIDTVQKYQERKKARLMAKS